MLGIYDYIGEIGMGLVAGPVEIGRQTTSVLTGYRDVNTPHEATQDGMCTPEAATKVAVETGKGMGRVVTASLKTPMMLSNAITRGFHNWPKAYGEEVREYENVTGIKSGFLVSAKVGWSLTARSTAC
jgi:hypothetical protein